MRDSIETNRVPIVVVFHQASEVKVGKICNDYIENGWSK